MASPDFIDRVGSLNIKSIGRAAAGPVLSLLYLGCQLFTPEVSPGPRIERSVNPTPTESSSSPDLEAQFHDLRARLADTNTPLFYGDLLNASSISFRWADGEEMIITLVSEEPVDGPLFACAPISDEKIAIHADLVGKFTKDAEVDRGQIQALTEGITNDCSGFQ